MTARQLLTSALVIIGATAALMLLLDHEVDSTQLLRMSAIAFVAAMASGLLVGKGARS
ncbi:MAG TPA: hypothetical protein VFK19_07825 [Sphingomicrobium sp.]|nr:hypothetical protein [Sphingomicrobium sp.]